MLKAMGGLTWFLRTYRVSRVPPVAPILPPLPVPVSLVELTSGRSRSAAPLGLLSRWCLLTPLLPEQRQRMRCVDDERSLRRAGGVVQLDVQGNCSSGRGSERFWKCYQSLAGLSDGKLWLEDS